MEISRRWFMNLLGIGGLVATTPKVVPLFGSDEERALVVPDAVDVGGHFVVYAKQGYIEKVPEDERKAYRSVSGGVPVARLIRTREPGGTSVPDLPERSGTIHIRPGQLFADDEARDPHTVFYMAAMEMRDRFASFSRETLKAVPSEFRRMASLVTVVDSSIHARPVGLEEGGDYGYMQAPLSTTERGFDVSCRFRQFVRLAGARKGVETFASYSDTGEYPIMAPRDVDMSLLMRLDSEIVSARATETPAVRAILRRFGRWVGGSTA